MTRKFSSQFPVIVREEMRIKKGEINTSFQNVVQIANKNFAVVYREVENIEILFSHFVGERTESTP